MPCCEVLFLGNQKGSHLMEKLIPSTFSSFSEFLVLGTLLSNGPLSVDFPLQLLRNAQQSIAADVVSPALAQQS